jgi:MFS family permease
MASTTKDDVSAAEHSTSPEDCFASGSQADDAPQKDTNEYGFRFWMIIISLCFTSLLTAIEATVTATALPSIARELDSRELYVWFVNALFLSRYVPLLRRQVCEMNLEANQFISAVVQPLFGQLADVFGRRWPTIFTVVVFALGSGIAGGATSAGMLIAGRTLQGVGIGGVNMLINIIVCDLVPQRKRGAVMGVVFAFFAVGSSLGPFVGGILVNRASWRWVFYIGLPVAGVSLVF